MIQGIQYINHVLHCTWRVLFQIHASVKSRFNDKWGGGQCSLVPRPTLLFRGGSGYETWGNVACEGSINDTMKETVTVQSHVIPFQLAYDVSS